MTCGPWRPIYLERYVKRIADLWTEIDVSALDHSARVKAAAEVETADPNDTVSFSITDPHGQEIVSAEAMMGDQSQCETVFDLSNVNLWWPVGYGKQPLYQLTTSLYHAVSSRLYLLRLPVSYILKGRHSSLPYSQIRNKAGIHCSKTT